jgi:hypothetical protein
VRTGLIASAATAGVIVGLGLRHASALTPFLLTGRATLTRMTGLIPSPALATLLGLLVHTFWMVLWGVCFSMVATMMRGTRLAVAALVFAVLVGVLASTVAPGALGAGVMGAQTLPQTFLYVTILAMSLLAGMRLARA